MGFRKLRPGRIHVRCYTCGRKVSNTARMEYDPPTATLIETPCEKCSQGCKDPPSYYYDATGAEVEERDSYDDDGECCGKPDGCTLDCDYRREMMRPEARELAVDPSRSTPEQSAVAVSSAPHPGGAG